MEKVVAVGIVLIMVVVSCAVLAIAKAAEEQDNERH